MTNVPRPEPQARDRTAFQHAIGRQKSLISFGRRIPISILSVKRSHKISKEAKGRASVDNLHVNEWIGNFRLGIESCKSPRNRKSCVRELWYVVPLLVPRELFVWNSVAMWLASDSLFS